MGAVQTLCERGFERGIERDEILLDAIRAWLSVVKTQEHRSLSVGGNKKLFCHVFNTLSTRSNEILGRGAIVMSVALV